MTKWIARAFAKGLLAILPLAATLFLLYWLGSGLESVLGTAVRWILPEDWYIPGMGLAVGIVAILALGVLLQTWLIRKVWNLGESILDRVPLVRLVYRAIKQTTNYLSGAAAEDAQQVVTVALGPDQDVRLLGFLTRTDLSNLPEGLADDQRVSVYLPMSYQMGGFTVIVPRDQITPVNMPLEQGLRFALTAGVSVDPDDSSPHAD